MLQTLPAETATTTWTQAKAVIRVYENSATLHKQLQVAQEAARCFVSSNILLRHSRSLKVIQNDTVE